MVKTLFGASGVSPVAYSSEQVQNRMKQKGWYWENNTKSDLIGTNGMVSHEGLIIYPSHGKVTLPNKDGKVFGPFLPRFNKEPWHETVQRVSTQFDTKRVALSTCSITVYWPMFLETMSWRITGRDLPNHWSNRVGKVAEGVSTIKQILTRNPDTFDAQRARNNKKHFAGTINSHCSSTHSYMISVAVREIFAFTLHEQLPEQTVHFLGVCPLANRKRGGPDQVRRASGQSAIESLSQLKFAIVFENSGTSGYITEKIVNAYLAETIPIYYGPAKEQLAKFLNPKAYVHCDVPANVARVSQLTKFRNELCAEKLEEVKGQECHTIFLRELEVTLKPYFQPCIDQIKHLDSNNTAYEQMLGENLVELDPETGEMPSFLNGKKMGAVVRSLMVGLGYDDRTQQ